MQSGFNLVDLDAALGKGDNDFAIGQIAASLETKIEVGRIRSPELAKKS
jgi:phosphoribosylformimino-5-aminoimidazole carboxamide ribonucleotide (ProFAR) isomerase